MFKMGNIIFTEIENDEKMKRDTYKLRYKIYVEEFGFEKAEDHPDGYETDIYDSHAVHFAGIDSETGEVIATTRLILNSEIGLPVMNVKDVMFVGKKDVLKRVVEVSRFAIDKKFRRRKEDILFSGTWVDNCNFDRRDTKRDSPDRRQRPIVVYGLFKLMYQATKRLNISFWSMISEKWLHESLTNMGFLFCPIGNEVYYHGLRTPYVAFIEEMEKYWIEQKSDFILFLSQGLEKTYWPKSDSFQQLMAQKQITV